MFAIRSAKPDDAGEIVGLDPLAREREDRRAFIARSVEAGACSLIFDSERLIGYAVLDYTFFGQGFISILFVSPTNRRQGAGSTLLRHLEALCRTRKLFTSANLSNLPMQRLLARQGFDLCGVVHGLDEGDPELVYMKYLNRM